MATSVWLNFGCSITNTASLSASWLLHFLHIRSDSNGESVLGAGFMDVSPPFAACVAVGALVVYADRKSSNAPASWTVWALPASLIAAMIAECSMASGVFVWLVLLLLSFAFKLDWKVKWLISIVGALAAVAFLWDLRSPVGKYVREYLSWSWDPSQPTDRLWSTFAQLCTTRVVSFVLIWFLRADIRCSAGPFAGFPAR
jgi:hypothetical protein